MTFSPLAWLKLQLFLHAGDTEVGGFGVSADHDLLYVTDFKTVKQYTTAVTVSFDDTAVADHFDRCVDAGLPPARFARIWVHTHPGDSPQPSYTDEETFARVFGGCDWALMFICSRTSRTYARLRFFAGPGGELVLPVQVDWAVWPRLIVERGGLMPNILSAWIAEFQAHVLPYPREGGFWTQRVENSPSPFEPPAGLDDELQRLHEEGWDEQEAMRRFDEEEMRANTNGVKSVEVPA